MVGRSESARADVGSKPTVACQIRRCLASQTLEEQDGDFEGHLLTHGQIIHAINPLIFNDQEIIEKF